MTVERKEYYDSNSTTVEYVYTIPEDELVEALSSEVYDASANDFSVEYIMSGRFGPLNLIVGDYLDEKTINYLNRNRDNISYEKFKEIIRDSINLSTQERQDESVTVVEEEYW